MAVVPLGKTARVFARLSLPPIDATDTEPQFPGCFAGAAALTAYMHAHGNDLMAAATEIVPEIADVIVALAATPRCQFAGLSGAGPTCYGIYPTLADAESAARGLRSASPRWWVAATALED
jgi:4-diphosphocytidyl-2-C-methyl-D-erythritol kinase